MYVCIYTYMYINIYVHICIHIHIHTCIYIWYPRRRKASLFGQSVGLPVPRSPAQFRQKLKKSNTQNLQH